MKGREESKGEGRRGEEKGGEELGREGRDHREGYGWGGEVGYSMVGYGVGERRWEGMVW